MIACATGADAPIPPMRMDADDSRYRIGQRLRNTVEVRLDSELAPSRPLAREAHAMTSLATGANILAMTIVDGADGARPRIGQDHVAAAELRPTSEVTHPDIASRDADCPGPAR
jgi:hypothetical protein